MNAAAPIIPPQTAPPRQRWRTALLSLYRLGLLVLAAWLLREHDLYMERLAGGEPLSLQEVRELFPAAARLDLDHGTRQGWHVLNTRGERLGYVVCTQPQCRSIIGYCGVTDTLIGFNAEDKVLGWRVRRSEDTIRHVEDVKTDRKFLHLFDDMYWEDLAKLDLAQAGVEGVSGATSTSVAIAESLVKRCALGQVVSRQVPWWKQIKVRARDVGLVLILVGALLLAFTRLHQYPRVRWSFQGAVVLYAGFLNGDLLAQSLLAGWARNGVNWQWAPGLALVALAAFVVPWATHKPLYCHHLCGYGFLQQWMGRMGLKRWRLAVPAKLDRLLRIIPVVLLLVVVCVVALQLPLDLANLEPFDAFLFRVAGWPTIIIALAGLVAALAVPNAYCKYGCPTGALLELARGRGAQDQLGWRDAAALILLLLLLALHLNYSVYLRWLNS